MICNIRKELFLIVIIVITSCQPNEKQRQLKEDVVAFETQHIVIPPGLLCVKSGQTLTDWELEDLPHLVYYYDSTECVGCRLQHVINLSPLFQEESGPVGWDLQSHSESNGCASSRIGRAPAAHLPG